MLLCRFVFFFWRMSAHIMRRTKSPTRYISSTCWFRSGCQSSRIGFLHGFRRNDYFREWGTGTIKKRLDDGWFEILLQEGEIIKVQLEKIGQAEAGDNACDVPDESKLMVKTAY